MKGKKGNLCLSLNVGKEVDISLQDNKEIEAITITVVQILNGKARISINAPKCFNIGQIKKAKID